MEEPQAAPGSPAPALAGPAEGTDLPSAEAAPAVSLLLLANGTRTQIQSDNPDPSVVGQGVYVAFRVDSDPYAGVTAYGWVTVTNGAQTCGRHCLPTDSYCPSNWTAWWWGCTITPLSAGAETITATFTAISPTIYNDSFDTDSHQVDKADTNTAIASAPPSPKACDTIVLTATVTVKSPGSGTPTGTVTFFDGDVSLGTGTSLGGGKWRITTPSLSAGQHSFTATYNGDANYNESTSTAISVMVAKTSSTTTVTTLAPNPSTFGNSVTLRATVTGTCGTPTGIVFFNDGGVTIGTATLNASGVADLVAYDFTAGVHEISAVYDGNATYEASMSSIHNHTVNRRSTTTTLSSSGSPSVWGQTVTFTATVSSSIVVTPTGQVIFWDGGTVIGSGTLDGSGRAVISTADLEVGSHPMTANYQGDENFLPGSGSLIQTVNKANATTLVVGCVPNPSYYGQSVMCTARVTPVAPGAGTPTGQITFNVDGIPKYTTTLGLINPGEATWVTSVADQTELKPAGIRNVTATYLGDNYFTCTPPLCTSPNYPQQVLRANTQVTIQSPLLIVDFGQQVQITAIVSAVQPGAGTITGTIVFSVNAIPVYTAVLTGTTQSATYSTNSLPVGVNTVCAQYLYGTNPNFNNSAQVCVTITVNKAQTKTSLASAPNPSNFGQMAVFTATVTPAGASTSTITPTGTVTFTFNSTGYMTGTLNALGVATVFTNTLPAGLYDVTADYGGDGNFLPSSATRQHTVSRNSTTTTLTLSPPSPAGVGTLVTFTAIVSSTGGVTPTGTVKFWDGLTVLGSGALNVSGVATFSTSALAAGSHSLKASYDGTPNFSPSSSDRQTYTITAAGSTTTLTSSQNPSVYGQNVTFQATVTGAGGTPTGEVTFKDGATTLGTAPLVAGVATFSTAGLAVGTHPITAVYGGDASFAGSTSNQVDQVVNKADTTTTITSDLPDPSVVGQPVAVNFTVVANAPGSGTPTGNVTVSDGTVSCTGSVAAGSCTLIPTTAGAKALTATYAGDSNFNGGSDTEGHQVDPASTTTTVTSSPNPSLPGQNVTLTANVTANPPGAGTPTGQVQFKSNGSNVGGPVALVGGSASVNTSFGSEGAYNITADYTNLDGNFNNSSGSTTHNVSTAPTDLSVTKADSPDPVNVGDNLTYVIVVTNHGPESTTVTLTDTLPSQVTFVSATPSQGSCSGTSTVTCNLGTMNNGDSATVTIVVNVPLTTPAGTVLRNTAEVKGTRPEPVPDPHPNTSTQETTVYRSPRRGDCNGDDAVNLADIWSIVRDIFDPAFQGTSGCDANQDRQVDAGDVPSTVLIMFTVTREDSPAPLLLCSSAPLPGPALTLPEEVQAYAGQAIVPLTFTANGHSITSLAFSVDYDETWLALDPTDRDGNGVPDAVVFGLPGDFTYSVTFDEGDADGEVDIFIGDINPPLTSLSDGPFVFMLLDATSSPGAMQGAVRFSLDPAASFGDTSGQSVPGTATPTGRYQHRIYLPMVVR